MKKKAFSGALAALTVLVFLYAGVVYGTANRGAAPKPDNLMSEPRSPASGPRETLLSGGSCPSVSCLTEQGYYECIGCPGCGCDPRTDACVPTSTPTPTPEPSPTPGSCPSVTCLTQQGYEECVSCPGCTCHPRTDGCVPESSIY